MPAEQEHASVESMFDSMLTELEGIDDTTAEICKEIREGHIKLVAYLTETYPEIEWQC